MFPRGNCIYVLGVKTSDRGPCMYALGVGGALPATRMDISRVVARHVSTRLLAGT
jgi:hypothetical protein